MLGSRFVFSSSKCLNKNIEINIIDFSSGSRKASLCQEPFIGRLHSFLHMLYEQSVNTGGIVGKDCFIVSHTPVVSLSMPSSLF